MKQTNSPQSDNKDEKLSYAFPQEIRHDFPLAGGGRNLSYYTFDTGSQENHHNKPVLYFHGFPGCGLEGAVCAAQVANAGGKLYAPSRPGFDHSDPYDDAFNDADEQVQAFCNDLWEFIKHEKWESFSVIAVSGGGPFALAFLSSYLEKQDNAETECPKLDAVSFVAAVCCSAGTEGMMKTNQGLLKMVQNQDKMLSRVGLNLMFALPSFLMSVVPSSLLLKLTPTKDLPLPDQETISHPQVAGCLLPVASLAFRQSYTAAVKEACIIFRPKQGCEDSLKRYYEQPTREHYYPRIAVYQGDLDVNVPKSHATFIQKELLGGTPELVVYPELGHISLVVSKANEYAQFAVLGVDAASS